MVRWPRVHRYGEGPHRFLELTLPDGLHPTAKGVETIVERILPTVESFLARASASRS